MRTAVRVLRRVNVGAVVSPIAIAGKLPDRHQLDRRNAEVLQRVEFRNDRVERSLARERADVQLVDHELFECNPAPIRVMPFEIRIDDFGRTVHTERLKPRRGIGPLDTVEHVEIPSTAGRVGNYFMIMLYVFIKWECMRSNSKLDVVAPGGPHPELATIRRDEARAECRAGFSRPAKAGPHTIAVHSSRKRRRAEGVSDSPTIGGRAAESARLRRRPCSPVRFRRTAAHRC